MPVLLAAVDPGAPASLREALERLEPMGGWVSVVKGQLVGEVPPEVVNGAAGVRVRAAVRALYLGEDLIVAAAKADGPVDPAKVPDRPLLPNGRLAP